MIRNSRMLVLLAIPLAGLASGCQKGPELGTVTGLVKVNGQPLPYAYVVFQPIAPGTYGSAYTDKEGKYELQFTTSRNGAPVGSHRVSIRAAARDELPDDAAPQVRLPEKFNSASELVREVKPGHNVHDFDLEAPPVTASTR